MSYLGLDVGTSGCKAAVFTENGTCITKAYAAYSVIHSNDSWAELDSNEVTEKCFTVIKTAVKASTGTQISAIAISSQGEAFTPVGKNGEFLCNAMISADGRAESIIKPWECTFGAQKLYNITGHTSSAIFSLFKLIWLRTNRPEIWHLAQAFYCFEDLIQFKLGLSPAIGWSLAGRTMLFDIKDHCWSEDILNSIGLDKSKLARPLPSGAIAGIIPDQIATELGLPSGVKVVAGGHDQTIGALGAGVVESGTAMFATGTVDCICPVMEKVTLCEALQKNNLCCYDYSLPDKYATIAYCLTGGNLLQWFRDEFGQRETALAVETGKSPYELLLNQLPDEPTTLQALPYFTPSGTPFFDPTTKGTILGLRLSTSRHEILKALLESVILEMKLNLQLLAESGIAINKLIVTGGGARNLKWVQLKADILNMPIEQLEIEEAGCFGAAMLACANTTNQTVIDIFAKQHRRSQIINPRPKQAKCYENKFKNYRTLYPMLKAIYQTINFD